MPDPHVLLIGATGFIAGGILEQLCIAHPTWPVTAFARNHAKAEILKNLKGDITIVEGTIDGFDLVRELSAKHDIVIQAADMFHHGVIDAIVTGLRERSQVTGTVPIFIQTSGIGTLSDGAQGAYYNEKIWSDLDLESLDAIDNPYYQPFTQKIIAAGEEKEHPIRTAIIFCPVPNGVGPGANKLSISFLAPAQTALKMGQTGFVGAGKNRTSYVHIKDLGRAFVVIVDGILKGKAATGYSGRYFVTHGEPEPSTYSQEEYNIRLGEILYARAVITTPIPSSYPRAFLDMWEPFVERAFGSNSVSKGDRVRALGWTPKHPTLWETMEDEVTVLLSEGTYV